MDANVWQRKRGRGNFENIYRGQEMFKSEIEKEREEAILKTTEEIEKGRGEEDLPLVLPLLALGLSVDATAVELSRPLSLDQGLRAA